MKKKKYCYANELGRQKADFGYKTGKIKSPLDLVTQGLM